MVQGMALHPCDMGNINWIQMVIKKKKKKERRRSWEGFMMGGSGRSWRIGSGYDKIHYMLCMTFSKCKLKYIFDLSDKLNKHKIHNQCINYLQSCNKYEFDVKDFFLTLIFSMTPMFLVKPLTQLH